MNTEPVKGRLHDKARLYRCNLYSSLAISALVVLVAFLIEIFVSTRLDAIARAGALIIAYGIISSLSISRNSLSIGEGIFDNDNDIIDEIDQNAAGVWGDLKPYYHMTNSKLVAKYSFSVELLIIGTGTVLWGFGDLIENKIHLGTWLAPISLDCL